MSIPLDEQIAWFDRKKEQTFAQCVRDFKNQKDVILREARRRLIEGFPTYGDSSWHKSYLELREDEMEEYADAVNYRLMRRRQGWPT